MANPEPSGRHPLGPRREHGAHRGIAEGGAGIRRGGQQHRHPGIGGQQRRRQLRGHASGAQVAAPPPATTPSRSPCAATSGMKRALRFSGIGIVETVDIGQQDQRVGADQLGHQCREPVVVTEPDLVGGHGVVLADDRHGAQDAQPVQGALRVQLCCTRIAMPCACQQNSDRPCGCRQANAELHALTRATRLTLAAACLEARSAGRLEQPSGSIPAAMAPEDTITTSEPAFIRPSMASTRTASRPRRRHPDGVVNAVVPILTTTLRAVRIALAMYRGRRVCARHPRLHSGRRCSSHARWTGAAPAGRLLRSAAPIAVGSCSKPAVSGCRARSACMSMPAVGSVVPSRRSYADGHGAAGLGALLPQRVLDTQTGPTGHRGNPRPRRWRSRSERSSAQVGYRAR